VARDVMSHRIVLGFDAVADNIAPAQVIERIVAMVPPPTPVWNAQATNNAPRPVAGQSPYVSQPEFR
jgi:MoxR-like ATPase